MYYGDLRIIHRVHNSHKANIFYDVKIIFYYIEKGVSFQKNKQSLLLIFIIIECQITQID